MKLSEKWLREWVNPPVTMGELSNQLTMAGFEVESVTAAAPSFDRVVVGEVKSLVPHPNADRLKHCQVDVGGEGLLEIVCGAANVRAGLKVAVVLIGGELPGGIKISKTKLRGIESYGMICSEKELGLSEKSDIGILELPNDAPVGTPLNDYLALDDHIIDINVTPNRGDCLSIQGIAREISARNHMEIRSPIISAIEPTIKTELNVKVHVSKECPHYVGRVIRNVKNNVSTPIWLREKLRRSGISSIHPIVDVMNYVMIELGQPLHAFDLKKIRGNLHVRMAKTAELITLLDGKELYLDSSTLVIADNDSVQAIAGIMGAINASVQAHTTDIFIESANFNANQIVLTAKRLAIHSESSHRFERGVDFALQKIAIERATALLQEIVGGEIGPIIEKSSDVFLNYKNKTILLQHSQIKRLLGIDLTAAEIEKILTSLGMSLTAVLHGWQVEIPSFRNDIHQEVDLIEEVARLYGYDRIPESMIVGEYQIGSQSETHIPLSRIRTLLVDRDYHEVVTFSFIDAAFSELLDPTVIPIPLANPISQEMAVMRTSIWPGLLNVLRHNQQRQMERIRLFESGMVFVDEDNHWQQRNRIGGLVSGGRHELQWGESAHEPVDFYDLKGDVMALLAMTRQANTFQFEPRPHPSLHPGQSAAILQHDRCIGFIGSLHPRLVQTLDLSSPPFLFELDLAPIESALLPVYEPISRFPAIRRDLAIIVDLNVPALAIEQTITKTAGSLLNKVKIFDIYAGEGIELGKKSVALGLTFQEPSRTLIDDEVNYIIEQVIAELKRQFGAKLRA